MTRRTRHHDRSAGAHRGFWRHKGGNIALITALVMIPLTFALGMAFDFTVSQSREDQLDGIADAAALGAVTPAEMALSCTTASTQSTNLFNGQEATVAGVTGLSVTVSGCPDTTNGNLVTRTITVTYTGQSQNVFASLLGMPTLPITGHSTATSSTAPNINFYLLLDTSPSMELAASSAGIATMQANTQDQGGCAFGCHQSNPTGDLPAFQTASGAQIACTTSGAYSDGTTFSSGSKFPTTGRDNYDLSLCLGVPLRIDLLRTGVQTLMSFANTAEQTNKATYQMALYETDTNQPNSNNDLNVYQLQTLTSDLTGAAYTAAGNISPLEVYQNSLLTASVNNNDNDTTLDADITSMNTSGNANYIPTPGNGAAGNTPQEVLFIVTDGMNDESVGSGGNCRTGSLCTPMDWSGAICSAVRARGIRIAVLYTTYNPTAGLPWYGTNVAPNLPTGLPPGLTADTALDPNDPMALGAQQCASPGLFYAVTNDADISTALQTLFQEAVDTARLLH
jgi:Flp pilus assembly protein TadG